MRSPRRSVEAPMQLTVRPPLLVAGLGLLFAIDLVRRVTSPIRVVAGVMDETAHLVTTVIVLSQAARPVPLALAAGALLGTVGIDVDHLPAELGVDALTPENSRPYSHSVLAVALAGLACVAVPRRWRAFAAGVTLGVVCHLWRDLATAGGVPLLWPLSDRSLEVRYLLYAVVQASLVVRSVLRGRSLTIARR